MHDQGSGVSQPLKLCLDFLCSLPWNYGLLGLVNTQTFCHSTSPIYHALYPQSRTPFSKCAVI